MLIVLAVVSFLTVYVMTIDILAARGENYDDRTWKTWGKLTLLTCRAYRWHESQLTEKPTAAGHYEVCVENRSAIFRLLGVIPVAFRRYDAEMPAGISTSARLTTVALQGERLDTLFPPHLAYSKSSIKTSHEQHERIAGAGA